MDIWSFVLIQLRPMLHWQRRCRRGNQKGEENAETHGVLVLVLWDKVFMLYCGLVFGIARWKCLLCSVCWRQLQVFWVDLGRYLYLKHYATQLNNSRAQLQTVSTFRWSSTISEVWMRDQVPPNNAQADTWKHCHWGEFLFANGFTGECLWVYPLMRKKANGVSRAIAREHICEATKIHDVSLLQGKQCARQRVQLRGVKFKFSSQSFWLANSER